jgi:hypothetical protein
MPWRVIHGRDRSLLVAGIEAGHPTFTRDPARALHFAGQAEAREWIDRCTCGTFGELALMREPGRSEGRKGMAQHYGART